MQSLRLLLSKTSLVRFILLTLSLPIAWPLLGSVGLKTEYTYANEYVSVNTSQVRLENPKTSFTVELQTPTDIGSENLIAFHIESDGIQKQAFIELEGDEWRTGRYLTAPVHFEPTDRLTISCQGCEILKNPIIHIIALDTRSSVSKLGFGAEYLGLAWAGSSGTGLWTANAIAWGITVVSRAEWGADETLRYKDNPIWQKYFAQAATVKTSEATKKANAKNDSIEAHLRSAFPEEFETNEVIRTENGHELVWPIEKSKTVNKIVLHHTAENNLSGLSDTELMRSMYFYHTISRGWGDMGYEYVIGQRGVVYEGRAGGDYVVGAHVSWNNRKTVGVSVIGNFEVDNLVREQSKAIPVFLSFLAKKYGIDTNVQTMGHKACKVDEICDTLDFPTGGLVGHRDIGYTACPGKNLYSVLTSKYQPDLAAETKGYQLVVNPVYRPETLTQPVKSIIPNQNTLSLGANMNQATLSKWPNIRIKLSAPDMKEIELEAIQGNANLSFDKVYGGIDTKKITISKKRTKLVLTMNGKKYAGKVIGLSGDLVRVNSWNHTPAWDKSWTYNDNVFRGKVEARLENGKIILVNELPLEDYLKGIAEISNGDNAEKAKTILVAARSYALWYTDPTNRKFPGKPYDGSDDPEIFQKYLWYGYEKRSPTSVQTVDETNGQVVTYSGALVKPWYFNESDGKTRSAKEYCESSGGKNCPDIPYLQSVPDPAGEWHTRKGHGVGVSGIGATYFATQKGWDYQAILKYYLTGIDIVKNY